MSTDSTMLIKRNIRHGFQDTLEMQAFHKRISRLGKAALAIAYYQEEEDKQGKL
jgi:hypothetical protein